jgi:hypothetical protein
VARDDQINGHVVWMHFNIGMIEHCVQEPCLDLASGVVARVHDTVARVPAFEPECQRSVIGGECDPELDELADARRPLAHHHLHDVAVAEPGARRQRVLDVQTRIVVETHHGRHAALGIVGIGVGQLLLGDKRHAPRPGEVERQGKARHSGADNEKVRLDHAAKIALRGRQTTPPGGTFRHAMNGGSGLQQRTPVGRSLHVITRPGPPLAPESPHNAPLTASGRTFCDSGPDTTTGTPIANARPDECWETSSHKDRFISGGRVPC